MERVFIPALEDRKMLYPGESHSDPTNITSADFAEYYATLAGYEARGYNIHTMRYADVMVHEAKTQVPNAEDYIPLYEGDILQIILEVGVGSGLMAQHMMRVEFNSLSGMFMLKDRHTSLSLPLMMLSPNTMAKEYRMIGEFLAETYELLGEHPPFIERPYKGVINAFSLIGNIYEDNEMWTEGKLRGESKATSVPPDFSY